MPVPYSSGTQDSQVEGVLAGLPLSLVNWRRLLVEGSDHADDMIPESFLEPPKLKRLRAQGIPIRTIFEWNREKKEYVHGCKKISPKR